MSRRLDPRTPVIVGAGQVTHRDRTHERSPLDLMAQAARLAERDSRTDGLLQRADSVAAVDVFSWGAADPARVVAAELGLEPEETVRTARGGSGPVELLGDLGARIAAGHLDVALVVGGEAVNPFMRARREDRDPGWPAPAGAPTRVVGRDRPPSHPAEERAGLVAPIFYYPVFEHALRAASGRGPQDHQTALARLWGRFAQVARDNPHAWASDIPDALQIGTPGPANRMVAHPYPKLMTANIQVDQAAALVLCSARAARDAGVPRERWVFLRATATAHDHWFAGQREQLHRSPAIAACGRAALGHAGLAIDDIAHLDFYSCFPSAVQVAAAELGLDLAGDARAPTVTGGLTFAGGPASNYVTHAVATTTQRLREHGGHGLVTGVGWYLTKHGVAILSADPPARPFAHRSPQSEIDRLPGREPVQDGTEAAQVEAYTAVYDRDSVPTMGIVSCLEPGQGDGGGDDGRRRFARTADPTAIEALVTADPIGARARLDGGGGFEFA